MRAVRKLGSTVRGRVVRSLAGVVLAVLLRPVVNARSIEALSDMMDPRD